MMSVLRRFSGGKPLADFRESFVEPKTAPSPHNLYGVIFNPGRLMFLGEGENPLDEIADGGHW